MSTALVLKSQLHPKYIYSIKELYDGTNVPSQYDIAVHVGKEFLRVEYNTSDAWNQLYSMGDYRLDLTTGHVWGYKEPVKSELWLGCCLIAAALWKEKRMRIDNVVADKRDELPFQWLRKYHKVHKDGLFYRWNCDLLRYPLLM